SVENPFKMGVEQYRANTQKLGADSSAVGWNTQDCQALRFTKLSSVISEGADYSVNDYGCGYGAHLKFLTDTLGHEVSAYNGYDISQEMLDTAQKELAGYKGALNLIRSPSITTQADY